MRSDFVRQCGIRSNRYGENVTHLRSGEAACTGRSQLIAVGHLVLLRTRAQESGTDVAIWKPSVRGNIVVKGGMGQLPRPARQQVYP